MGIKGLPTQAKKIPKKTVNPETFRYKKIPIDILGLMYQKRWAPHKAAVDHINPFFEEVDEEAVDDQWIAIVLKSVIEWMSKFKFIPFFVFDGPMRPLKAKMACAKRDATRDRDNQRATTLRTEYAEIDDPPPSAVQELRTLVARQQLVPQASKERFRKFFEKIIPCVTVNGDAERYCARYSAEHKVPVISKDSDCYAHLAYCVIDDTEPVKHYVAEEQTMYNTFEARYTDDLLDYLKLDAATFQDLCIFSGTDYNDNIPNLSFGNGLKLFRKYGKLEDIELPKGKLSDLNHIETRLEFAPVGAETLVIGQPTELLTNKDLITEHFNQQGKAVASNLTRYLAICEMLAEHI